VTFRIRMPDIGDCSVTLSLRVCFKFCFEFSRFFFDGLAASEIMIFLLNHAEMCIHVLIHMIKHVYAYL